jgi:hypothetical protein
MTAAARARPAVSWAALASLAAVVGLGASACHRDIRLLPVGGSEGGAGAGVGGAAGAGLGGTAGTAGAAGATVACLPPGDPIKLPTTAGATACAAALETRGHRFALCTCDSLTLDGKLRTDAFDSTDSTVGDQTSAAVGVDGALQIQANAELRAGGAIYVAGSAGVSASDHLQAGASFYSNGPLAMLASNADLLANAYVAGDVSGSVRVTDTLFVPVGASVGADVQAHPLVTGAVAPLLAPCDCGDGFVNVAGAITAAATSNGNAAAGFSAGALSGVSTATSLDLRCGVFYLSAVSSSALITLTVHGHVLLAVAGSVVLGGGLTVMLDQSAELDLLVGGWLTASGGTVGAPAAPARFRIWIDGSDSLVFDHQPTIAAVVHAPNAPAIAHDGLTLSGSLLVESLTLGAGSQSLLHYDRAILSAGVPCGEPAAAAP